MGRRRGKTRIRVQFYMLGVEMPRLRRAAGMANVSASRFIEQAVVAALRSSMPTEASQTSADQGRPPSSPG